MEVLKVQIFPIFNVHVCFKYILSYLVIIELVIYFVLSFVSSSAYKLYAIV